MGAPLKHGWIGPRRFLHLLGPGLITGAADDDPSGIATYSQTGAQFGFQLLWTMFLTLPFMVAIQIISACIGWQTGQGLSRNIAHRLPRVVLLVCIGALAVANTINIAADLAAMADGLRLVIHGPSLAYAAGFGIVCLIAEVFVPYHRYARYLKFLTLVLFVYVAAAFSVHVDWGQVARSTFLPTFSFRNDYLLTIVAVFGTTISPYLFFWQASQEAEESALSHRKETGLGHYSARAFRHISYDTWTGMLTSNIIGFFIIVTTGATLHQQGVTNIQTAAQAAEALRPIAGELTFALFAGGIIGTGLLAVPVLAGSAAYAVSEAFGIGGSLELPARRALGFYGIISAATLGGLILVAAKFDPIAMLFWTAVINGIVAVPIMAVMMLVVSGKAAGGKHGGQAIVLPRWLRILGWLGALMMAVTVGALLWTSLPGL
ncbi:MAG: divalent metal cation transporter [Proteobacteria bacterium]|jgi:NRAMP (natural resistance-associated macrophage protein)-like metal ion transporter|nr:divalent metal cation transporter [Pseudomonadota bacterium]